MIKLNSWIRNRHNTQCVDLITSQAILILVIDSFKVKTIFAPSPITTTLTSEDVEFCRSMSTYPNAHAKVQKRVFEVQFPENYLLFGIIGNDFEALQS